MTWYWNREITIYEGPSGEVLFGSLRRYSVPFRTMGRYHGWGLWAGSVFIGVMVRTREIDADALLKATPITTTHDGESQ